MRVGTVGGGPAIDAARRVLADVDADLAAVDPGELGRTDLAVVADDVGGEAFDRANRAARGAGTPWLAVELGGVGGRALPEVEASVSGYAPATGCFECLRGRVAANADAEGASGADGPTARLAGTVAGREAARLLAGEESPVLGGVLEVPHARRRFLPLPGCDCGATPARELARDEGREDAEAVLERAELALDDRVGVVREVGEAESFPAPYYLATLCDTTGFSGAEAAANAAGVAADWNGAFVKALGEGLERYCAGVYRASAFERSPASTLDDAVAPGEFVLSPGFDAPDPDEPLAWVRGENLHTGESVRLPAEFVVFPPPEHRHRPSITTGLGLGSSGVEALLSGLYEVVERDAAMLSWYSTFDPLGLAVDDEGYRELAGRARAVDLSASAVVLTQDVDVPVVAAAVQREEWPRFAAGMSAGLDARAAARGALAEALQNWMELRGMGPEDAAEETVGAYADDPGRAAEFFDPGTTVPAASVGPDEVPTGRAELDAVLSRVADAGATAYGARLTTRDVESIGFEAVRVLVPSAQPLFSGDAYFGERAREVPAELGFEPRLDREHHPFP